MYDRGVEHVHGRLPSRTATVHDCDLSLMTSQRPPRPARAESREVQELRQIKEGQPDLASAVDMQIALLDLQRRMQGRVPMPWREIPREWIERLAHGKPMLHFEDVPLDWTEFRLMVRQTADILHRFEALEPADYAAIQSLGRAGHTLEPIVAQWYTSRRRPRWRWRSVRPPLRRLRRRRGSAPVC